MSKKTFKNKTEHLDKFFSEPEEKNGAEGTQQIKKDFPLTTGFTTVPAELSGGFPATQLNPKKEYYRINLKLDIQHKKYLDRVAWENKKSITQYINDLIEKDKINNDT